MSSKAAVFVTSMTFLGAGCAERASDEQSAVGDPFVVPHDDTWFGPEERWLKRGGRLICTGYLSRVESDRFCSFNRPPDWQPFEYADESYFVQPLTHAPLERGRTGRSMAAR
ncbi:MAG: hypothetical protein AAF417_13435 [Pseudomonadota bacterium]